MYDGFDSSELHQFRQNFWIESDITITSSENFPGKILTPRNDRVSLPDDIYELLVYYYNDAYYDLEFVKITSALILEEKLKRFYCRFAKYPNIDALESEAKYLGWI